jgi:hypothetical protein
MSVCPCLRAVLLSPGRPSFKSRASTDGQSTTGPGYSRMSSCQSLFPTQCPVSRYCWHYITISVEVEYASMLVSWLCTVVCDTSTSFASCLNILFSLDMVWYSWQLILKLRFFFFTRVANIPAFFHGQLECEMLFTVARWVILELCYKL